MKKLDSICIWLVANYNFLWIPLAETLKQRYGCRVVGLCRNKADQSWFEGRDRSKAIDDYVILEGLSVQYGNVHDSYEEVFRKASDFERRYGCVYPEIMQTDRHLGRGYSALGLGHSRSKLSVSASHSASVDFLNKIFEFWEALFAKYMFKLVIGGGSGIMGKPFALVMRGKGAVTRSLRYSRYKNYFYWAEDEFGTFPGLEERFQQIRKDASVSKSPADGELEGFGVVSKDNIKYFGINPFKTLKSIAHQIALNLYKRFRGISTYGNYLLRDQVWEMISHDLQILYLRSMRLPRLKDIKGRRFFFYALQTEPETSTTTISPEFNEQLAAVELIAKALPSEYILVVKEHPFAIGRRPYFLYRLLPQIPNVIFLDFRENALEIAGLAAAVVTISGSIGYEATVMGKPVLSFGKHNWHDFLDNTIIIRELHDVKAAVREAIGKSGDSERYRHDGRSFLKALSELSFEWDFDALFHGKRSNVSEHELDVIVDALDATL